MENLNKMLESLPFTRRSRRANLGKPAERYTDTTMAKTQKKPKLKKISKTNRTPILRIDPDQYKKPIPQEEEDILVKLMANTNITMRQPKGEGKKNKKHSRSKKKHRRSKKHSRSKKHRRSKKHSRSKKHHRSKRHY